VRKGELLMKVATKAYKIRSEKDNKQIKTWVASVIMIFLLFFVIALFDVTLGVKDTKTLWLTVMCGIPIVTFGLCVYIYAKTLGNLAYITALVTQAAAFAVVVYDAQPLHRYFFMSIIIMGTFSLIRTFKQMIWLIAVSSIFNLLVLIFLAPLPQIESLDFHTFLYMFLLYFFTSFLMLLQSYSVTQKESHSDKALEAFSSLLVSTPNLMVITDKESQVRFISEPMARFAGFSQPGFAIGQPLLDLFTERELKLMFSTAFEAEGLSESIIPITIDNEKRYFKVIADKLTGEVGGSFIDISDITQLENSKRAAEKSQKEAEYANAAKSQFLATMSHEIRTPMNAILGITQMELNDQGTEKNIDALEKIYTSGNTLLGIINDILDLSKIESGKLELSQVDYDVPGIIYDSAQLNVVRIGTKNIKFLIDVDENLPSRMIGDELRIRQILNNLLSNAFKYTAEGHVKLAINHHLKENDEINLKISVEDTGQGLKPEDCEKLFAEEYMRFNTEFNRETEGTGIGLNITQNLVRLMNGEIKVESEYGKGSVFTVNILQKVVPNATPIGAKVSEKLKNFDFDGKKERRNIILEIMPYGKILVVDDVETNLYVARGLMSPYQLQIDTAVSGFEAIEMVKTNTYDIIFMDHMMPVLDGIETTKKIRRAGYEGTIIALTANAIVGNDKMFRENGFDDFISKPIDVRQLNAILNRWVRDKHPDKAEKYSPQIVGDDVLSVPQVSPKLLKIFCEDAKKAMDVLRTSDISLFTTTVHAMKSALANIGKTAESEQASKLEEAGRKKDNAFISAHIDSFIGTLENLIKEYSTHEIEYDDSDITEDISFLKEQLLLVKSACDDYNSVTALAILDSLKDMKWKNKTMAAIEKIHYTIFFESDFDKAVELVERFFEN